MLEIERLKIAMTDYFKGDMKRINHYIKVHSYAKCIGELENLSRQELFTLEVASIVHDIGIKNSEIKYNSSAGKYQEIEGVPEARKLLESLNFEKSIIDRVCYLVGHHHTYDNIQGLDYQILVEADFLVNLFEDSCSTDGIKNIKSKIFKTDTGIL
ncbi:MAG: HD domain-containing protein, partial [Ruminococcus sp.]|nr:HD domain-containing protein [Ruminococcus sp.]